MNFPGKLLLGALLALSVFSLRAADDPLAWPPITSQTKPWAFNWWMGSAVDKTNLTRELERYAAAGLGGVHIIPIYGAKGFEDKYISYLSPQWMEMMGWTVSEAKRLGMGVDMTTGSGWCFGGSQVTDEDANASVIMKTYQLGVGERIADKFKRDSIQALVAYGPNGKCIELTDAISTNGECFFSPPGNWISTGTNSAPPKTWTVYAISQKPSGQKVKRAGPGGEGWMLNLIYPHAMDDFLKPYTAAFAAYTGPKPRAQYHDSYEYRSDWSPDFFAQFEKRRGYRLQTELPALFSTKDEDHVNRVKCDYRQTVSEIMADSLSKWVNWSHDRGFITRDQAHGSPGNWLDLYATADIPETEMFHTDRNKLISKFASSAAHVTGKPLVSAETGTWLEEHFTEKLSDVKYLMDDMFLSGVNHMFYHGCCYSPDEAGWPGWHFYASLEMNPRNSIWHDADAVNAYAARVQSVLQSGQPDNDILVYYNAADFWMQPGDKLLPQLTVHARDWFEGQPIGKTAKELWDKGYSFDYVSDAQLKTAKVVSGKIQMPGGNYKVIVVPPCKYIPFETYKQLLDLVQDGAQIIMQTLTLPTDVTGFGDLEKRRADFKMLVAKTPKSGSMHHFVTKAPFGKGFVIGGDLSPDDAGATAEKMAGYGLSYVRRSFEGGWFYFIANRSDKLSSAGGWFPLSVDAKSVEIMDPMTGKTGMAQIEHRNNNSTWVFYPLAAGESVILRAFADKQIEGTAWSYPRAVGRSATPGGMYFVTSGWTSGIAFFSEISGDWKIKFLEGGPVLPADFQTNRLVSWTMFPDTNCQAFAGTAKYEITFYAPSSTSKIFDLSLGNVQQSARVKLNGKDYGTLITPPFRVVVDNLKPTGNTLEVEVTSVAANRIRDLDRRGVKWKTFRDINIVDINYKPFDASKWPLTDCGLLGPVTLTPVKPE